MKCMDAKDRDCSDLDIVQLNDDPQQLGVFHWAHLDKGWRCLKTSLLRERLRTKTHGAPRHRAGDLYPSVCGQSWFNMCTFIVQCATVGQAHPAHCPISLTRAG